MFIAKIAFTLLMLAVEELAQNLGIWVTQSAVFSSSGMDAFYPLDLE